MSAPYFADIADAPLPAAVEWLHAADGTRLRAALWHGGGAGVVAIFPGRTEAIEKYGPTVAALCDAGLGAAVIDWRGQGLADRLAQAPLRGDVRDFAGYQQDVAAYTGWLDHHAPGVPRVVLAHSMGGCIALRALLRGLNARAVAFSAPMWGVPLAPWQARAVPALTAALALLGRDTRIVPGADDSYQLWAAPFEGNLLTRDRARYAWAQAQLHAHPELRLGAPSLRWLAAALREMAALAGRDSPALPALCAVGGDERVVSRPAIAARMRAWTGGACHVVDGARHELLMEQDGARRAFLDRAIALFRAHLPG